MEPKKPLDLFIRSSIIMDLVTLYLCSQTNNKIMVLMEGDYYCTSLFFFVLLSCLLYLHLCVFYFISFCYFLFMHWEDEWKARTNSFSPFQKSLICYPQTLFENYSTASNFKNHTVFFKLQLIKLIKNCRYSMIPYYTDIN